MMRERWAPANQDGVKTPATSLAVDGRAVQTTVDERLRALSPNASPDPVARLRSHLRWSAGPTASTGSVRSPHLQVLQESRQVGLSESEPLRRACLVALFCSQSLAENRPLRLCDGVVVQRSRLYPGGCCRRGAFVELLRQVVVGESKKKVRKWAAANGVTFPVLLDEDGKAARAWAPEGAQPDLPRDQVVLASNAIVDRDGTLAFFSLLDSTRFDAKLVSLRARLDELLKDDRSPDPARP